MSVPQDYKSLVMEARSQIKEISVSDLSLRLKQGKKTLLIDVREDDEWREAHIPGAIHIGRGVLERDIEEEIPDRSKELLLICAGGSRSLLAAVSLKAMGYQNVLSVAGGMREWISLGEKTQAQGN